MMFVTSLMINVVMMMMMLHDGMRRETGEEEVRVKVLYCGICHSDLHCLKNEWHSSIYPLVPGYAKFHVNFTFLGSLFLNWLVFFFFL